MDPSVIVGALLGAAMIGYLIFVRAVDLPKAAPVSPFRHLDERKAAIYESLRDLQFEYRLDKLSDEDYNSTKIELQKELAKVRAEEDRVKAELGQLPSAKAAAKAVETAAKPAAPVAKKFVCPACNAQFEKALKFCGECGKPMTETETA